MEWSDFYEKAHSEDLLRFYDHHLKGIGNGWQETPRVRYSVLDLEGGDRIDQPAREFPPEDFAGVKLYLHAAFDTLSTDAPSAEATTSYGAESEQGRVSFTIRFDSPTEFVGYPKARLWLEAEGSDDMDVFMFLQKLNAEGEPLELLNVPNHGPQVEALTRNGPRS